MSMKALFDETTTAGGQFRKSFHIFFPMIPDAKDFPIGIQIASAQIYS